MSRCDPLRTVLIAGCLLALMAPPVASESGQTLDFEGLAGVLVERMDLQPGERVLLMADPSRFEPLLVELRRRVTEAGAVDLGALSLTTATPRGWATEFTRSLEGKSRTELVPLLEDVDLAVMMPGADPSHGPYKAMQDVLWGDRGRTIHFHWSGAYDLNEEPLDPTSEIDSFYQQAILETDYAVLAASQLAFDEAMRGRRVRVTTPAGTDLEFEIGDRPATRQDGNAAANRAQNAKNLIDREIELPAGAVRVAPLETTVSGVIVFPPSEWRGESVRGLTMHFANGRVVSFEAESGRDAVAAELESAGETGRSFREFVLGMNPKLAIPEDEPWIPYYGYGAGVVRLSLGDNSELGGQVTGGWVRWNFFTDATVTVGDEVWVRDGKLAR